MFTGIIEAIGEVVDTGARPSGRTLVIAAPFADRLSVGQSVAVDGACLTACARGDGSFTVDVAASTLERTVAGDYGIGSLVNLERAVRAGDRLDGHLVQGHVDGRAVLLEKLRTGDTRFLTFSLPDDVFATTIPHGSITLNGISLTVNDLREGSVCEVAIIPYSWSHTNLSSLRPGDAVNVEADLVGRYVRRVLETRSGASPDNPPGHAV